MNVKRFDSSEGNVWKYVFDFGDAIAEAVLYRYDSFQKRTVLCISVQSGCPVGCKFCGTGKQFIRNLTGFEIVKQVQHCLVDMSIIAAEIGRFQIMFMSMGEPMLNFSNVSDAIQDLNRLYPNAELLVSTMAPRSAMAFCDFTSLSIIIDKVGLQFSIHEAIESKRNDLIPFVDKYSLREIRDCGILWNEATKRPVFLNYCINENNHRDEDLNRFMDLFSPTIFNVTLSVICSADENMKSAGFRNLDVLKSVAHKFLQNGYNVKTFNPAGQDDIGGGCGQLWYVQEWMKNNHK